MKKRNLNVIKKAKIKNKILLNNPKIRKIYKAFRATIFKHIGFNNFG